MAFIDFSDAAHQALSASRRDLAAENTTSGASHALSVLDHRVIELARQDSLETLRPQRKRGWFTRLILGPAPASPMLANEQLEALRRLAVQVWHNGYLAPVSALKEAQAAGYTEDQIGAVVDTIGRLRSPFRRLAA